MNKQIQLRSQLQSVEVTGQRQFGGYASVFGNENSYGFNIAEGAFDEVLASGEKPAMFFNHEFWDVPVGIWKDLHVDERGLKVFGELTEGNPKSDALYAAIKHGAVSGLSISIYFEENNLKNHVLSKVDRMPEISLVTFPSDDMARITESLSQELEARINRLSGEKEYEDFLRDVGGLSRARAKQFLSCIKSQLQAQREVVSEKLTPEMAEVVQRLLKLSK